MGHLHETTSSYSLSHSRQLPAAEQFIATVIRMRAARARARPLERLVARCLCRIGLKLVIPAGALTTDATLTVTQATGTAPSGAISAVFRFGPDGTTFQVPVTVTLPVATGTTAASIYWTKKGSATEYESLPTDLNGTTATAQVTHFSLGFVGESCTAGVACTPANPCHTGVTICNGTPTCVESAVASPLCTADTQNDPLNCGACGHSCLD